MKNTKAKLINIMGWCIIILGVIGSYSMGATYRSISVMVIGFLSTLFVGLLIIGLAEIIELLQKNYNVNVSIEAKMTEAGVSVNQHETEAYDESLPPL